MKNIIIFMVIFSVLLVGSVSASEKNVGKLLRIVEKIDRSLANFERELNQCSDLKNLETSVNEIYELTLDASNALADSSLYYTLYSNFKSIKEIVRSMRYQILQRESPAEIRASIKKASKACEDLINDMMSF